MGRPLSELGETMTSEEFALHMALEIQRQEAMQPKGEELDWCDGMD